MLEQKYSKLDKNTEYFRFSGLLYIFHVFVNPASLQLLAGFVIKINGFCKYFIKSSFLLG